MLSQTTEYALRAIVFLSDHPEQAHTAEKIAAETKVPVGYLAKIMQGLAKTGLVTSQRGLYGGFTMAKDPKTLTVYEIVQSVDPIIRIERCPMEFTEHGLELCPLHRTVDNAMGAAEAIFKRTTVASLLNQPQANKPLCRFPRRVTTPAE